MNKIDITIGKPTVLTKNRESLYITYTFSLIAEQVIRSLTAKNYIGELRAWEVPITSIEDVLSKFKDFDISINCLVDTDVDVAPPEKPTLENTDISDFQFKTAPFDHQIEGMLFGRNTSKFLLADDQGLGKTKQALDLAVSRKGEFKHCLIVCGVSSVKHNWLQEIGIHTNETGHILGSHWSKKGKLMDVGSMHDRLDDLESDMDDFFLITNVETFRQGPKSKKISSMTKQELVQKRLLDRVEKLCQEGTIGMVVIDEIHKLKNPTGIQGKAIHRLTSQYRMALTGTPVVNSPIDVFNILKWLEVEDNTFTNFKNYYCVFGGHGGFSIIGYKNMTRLKDKLHGVMLRRKKEDVLNLPPKIKKTEYIELGKEQDKLYQGIRSEIIDMIDDIVISPNPLAMLTRLRQVTSCPQILSDKYKHNAKFDRLSELVSEAVEGGQKVIVFSNWSKVTKAAKALLEKYNPAYIDGEVKERMDEVNRFQNDPDCHVIIGTIGAMGTGLTLTAASNVIFIDKPWNPANTVQAEDRAHRIGTKGTVNIITLVAKDTIDNRIEELLAEKQDAVDGLVEGNVEKLQKMQLIQRLLD